jgi:hypothetical protein
VKIVPKTMIWTAIGPPESTNCGKNARKKSARRRAATAYTLYFVAKFDADFTNYGTWKDATVNANAKTASGGTSLSISDWTPGNTQAGNTPVFETTHRATTAGTDTSHAAMYSITVPVAAGKQPAWIRLSSPTSGNAAIHVFAIALDGKLVVSTSGDSPVGGVVGATLALTLGGVGGPVSFGAFIPGVTKDYTASTTATVTSTAADAALSVSDPGHLSNGSFSLDEPLAVDVAPASWNGPVTGDAVAITFKQHVDASDPLRTGTYSRTLTFTLSTTNP